MRRRSLVALPLVCLLAVVPAAARDKDRPPPAVGAQVADNCAEVRGSVRMEAYGYTHLVTLQNGCAKAVACELWTDVDPEPRVRVEVAPGAAHEIITRRGSPAREVRAFKKCSFR